MVYRFKHREIVEDGLHRIAREQLDRAIAEINEPAMETAEVVHQVRKRLKKLRGLLRLVRPALGKRIYQEHNRNFRDLGRALAVVRDASVMLGTLEDLRELAEADHEVIDLSEPRRLLVTERERLTAGPAQDPETRTRMVGDALRISRRKLDEWGLAAEGYAALGPGLGRSYARGRKALKKARNQPSDSRFHELRKRVKDHWYHTRLLENIWSRPMQARAGEMKRLSDLLGDEHDLAVLRQWLEEKPSGTLPESTSETLRHFISRRQDTLRGEAQRLGRRVYAERPKHFRRRMGACWRIWRENA